MVATLLALLALATQQVAAAPPPELQVVARSASGAEQPEFAHAVSRALVVTGATVVLGTPGAEPCARCVAITVVEEARGRYRIEARRKQRSASGQVEVKADSTPFEKARAVAVEARLLARWPATEEAAPVPEEPAPARPEPAKAEPARSEAARVEARVESARPAPAPSPPTASEAPAPASAEPPTSAPEPTTPRVEAPPPDPAGSPTTPPPAAATPAAEAGGAEATTPAPAAPGTQAPADVVAEAPREAPAASAEVAQPAPRTRTALWPWIPTAVGAATALAAGGCAVGSRIHYDSLINRTVTPDRAPGAREDGKTLQIASFVLAGVAAAALAAGIVGFVQGGEAEAAPRVSVGVGPTASGGVAVGVSGKLP